MAGEPVLVGRAGDLAQIRASLDRALAEQPGTVLVLGEAGVGKTTTVRAAISAANDRGFVSAVGSCAEGSSSTSFAPFRAAVRSLTAQYADGVVTAAAAAVPASAALLPSGLRPTAPAAAAADAGELYDAVLELLGALACDRPLLLVLEDLHWADRSTLELLSFLARNLAGERVVLMGTVRTEDVAPDSPASRTLTELARLSGTTRIDLRGLDVAGLQELVEAHGSHLATGELEMLHERTGGNPFFALELLAAEAVTAGALPPSVTDAIAIRLGTLPAADLELVRAAAVVGTEVRLLERVVGRPKAAVEASLRAAVSNGVLGADVDSGEVVFRHALVREVAHAGLLATERARLHEAAALVLEERATTDAAVLAHHYAAAYRPVDALRTSIAAARAHAGQYGSVDAVDHYRRAVDLWDAVTPAQRPAEPGLEDLLQEAMLCALNVGAVAEGDELASRLLARLDAAADPERWALCAARRAELRWELRDGAGAAALLDEAEHHLAGRDDSVARARVLEQRAFQAIRSRHPDGPKLAREALDVARRVGDVEMIVVALSRVALAASAFDEPGGRELLHEAFDAARRAGLPHEMSRSAINLLLLLHTGGQLDEVITAGARVLAAATALDVGPSQRAALTALYARALVDVGDWERAEDLLAGLHLPNAHRLRTYVAIASAELATAKGDVELAHRMLGEGHFDTLFLLALRRACVEAELALVDEQPHLARSVVDQYLPFAEFVLDATHARLTLLGLSSLAPGEQEAADAYLAATEQRDEVVRRAGAVTPPDQAAWVAAARATHATVVGGEASALWHEAASRFGAARLVVRRGWAQAREAAAIVGEGGSRATAAELAGAAHALAASLGAEPLRRHVEALVRAARLEVPGVGRLAEGSLGLTTRESEVLRLVAAGNTNREIADALYISAKTASVHVSNILRKVGATTRGEAAAIAHREGLAGAT